MKQFIINIRVLIKNIQTLFGLLKQLNKTLFIDNPITYKELYQWVKLHWLSKVVEDLKRIWDRHNDYDVETL